MDDVLRMVRRLPVVLVCVGVAIAAFAKPVPAGPARPLLGIVWPDEGRTPRAELVRVDERSLRPVGKRAIPLWGASGSWSFSPNRTRLVVAHYRDAETDNPTARLRLVDPVRLRVVGNVPLGRAGIESIAWLAPDRVLVLTSEQVIVVEPDSRRIVDRQPIGDGGGTLSVGRSHQRLVALTGALDAIGPARLTIFDARGTSHRVTLDKISAGRRWEDDVLLYRQPGLAVDPNGERAFVVSTDRLVAEVDLETLSVHYHTPTRSGSRLSWLKASAGPSRYARWLGEGLIAVSGADEHAYFDADGHLQLREAGAGVEIIDTRDWTFRVLDPEARFFSPAPRQLLATAWLWDSAARRTSGIGLRAYAFDGRRRFHLFGRQPINVRLVFRGRAYVGIGHDPELRIVDLARGRVIGKRTQPLPSLLLD